MGPKNVFYFIAATGVVAHCLHLGTPFFDGPRCSSPACKLHGTAPKPLTEEQIDNNVIVVIGSEVASGSGVSDGNPSWVTRLEELVKERNMNKMIANDAVYNYDLQESTARWANQPALEKASAVIISLNLPFAEFSNLTAKQQTEKRDSWLSELKSFADSFHVPVFLGGVFPYGRSKEEPPTLMEAMFTLAGSNGTRAEQPTYIEEHLLECNRIMKTWKYPLFDWLSATDDGTGAWRAGMPQLSPTCAVPNEKGHKAMVEAITPKQIDMLAGLK